MKKIKRYLPVVALVIIVALIVIRLIGNKQKIDTQLKAMTEYSSVIPVEVAKPVIGSADIVISENGVVRSGGEITILSETSGKALFVTGRAGDAVVAGSTLLKVESDVLENQVILARQSMENAERDYKRYSNLAVGDAITQQQLEGAKVALLNARANYISLNKQLENTKVISPVNGVVSARFVEKGDIVMPGNKLFTLIDKSKMALVIKLPEASLKYVPKGSRASVTIDALNGNKITGVVRSIGVSADMAGRYDVEISIPANDNRIREGLNGNAEFIVKGERNGMILPRKAITGSINDASVFVVKGDSVVVKRIRAGYLNEKDMVVYEGLSEEDQVVLSGQINLTAGTKVKILKR